MTIKRYDDWPERLFAFFDSKRDQPFSWGKNDCAVFVIDAIEALTGEKVAEQFRRYRSAAGAQKMLRASGGMVGIVESLAYEHVAIGFAQRGDIVIADMDGRDIYGIVAGNGFYCSPGEEGMMSRPMAEARQVFRF